MAPPAQRTLPLRELPGVPRPSDAEQARQLNQVWRYLEETGLQRCAESLCADALQDPCSVPANPYPAFTHRARQLAQSRRLQLEQTSGDETFRRAVSFPITLTAVRHIAGAKGCSHVWGLPSILRCVSPQEMGRYRWLLEDATPPLSTIGNHSPYTVQVACALTGPCIFSGTFFPASPTPSLDLLQTYIITGPHPHHAHTLYAQNLRSDVIRMSQQGRHHVLRITVPSNVSRGFRSFSKEEVCLQGSGFEEAVRRCLDSGAEELVRVECVWRVDPQGSHYQWGSKAYCLTVVQTASGLQDEERVLSHPQRPLVLLSCSVFPQQAQAEAFARAHIPTHRDGGADVFAPVRDVLTERLSALRLPLEVIPAAHICCTLFLLLQDIQPVHAHSATAQTPLLEALQQMWGFGQSPAARLWAVRQNALRLCQLLQARPAQREDAEVSLVLARRLRQQLLEGCVWEGDPLSSWYRDAGGSRGGLGGRLQGVCDQLFLGSSRTALNELREWYWSSSVLECQLVSDILPSVPVLQNIVQRAAQGAGGTEEQEVREQRGLWEGEMLFCRPLTLDLTLESAGDGARLQRKLSQYLADCAVDQCWEQCLWGVLSLSPLPSNPFPSLAQEFRLATLRRAHWQQSDAELQRQLWPPRTLQPCSTGGPLHCGPGGEGYGLACALRASHPERLQDCLARARSLESPLPVTARFKVAQSTAVLSPRAWLGMLSPFLCGLQVVEFCYITAPPGCLDEVLQVYAKLVLVGVSGLSDRDGLIVLAVDLGPGGMWDLQEVTAYPTHFQECFSDALRHGHPVHLKALQAPRGSAEWRFLPLEKRFVLYCLHQDGSAWQCLPHHDPLALHQAVFTSQEQAALHFNTVGRDATTSGGLQEAMSLLESEIIDAFRENQVLQGYRLAAMMALLNGEEACLLDCWRVCHSICAQTEYLSAVADCLQGLFELCGEDKSSEPNLFAAKYQPAVDRMYDGLSWIVKRTLEHPETLAPPGVWETILQGQGAVAGGSRVEWLRGLIGGCRSVSEPLSQDLLSLCPRVRTLVERLESQRERDALKAQISCTETVKLPPPNSQTLPRCVKRHLDQSTSQNTPLTRARALVLF